MLKAGLRSSTHHPQPSHNRRRQTSSNTYETNKNTKKPVLHPNKHGKRAGGLCHVWPPVGTSDTGSASWALCECFRSTITGC